MIQHSQVGQSQKSAEYRVHYALVFFVFIFHNKKYLSRMQRKTVNIIEELPLLDDVL